MVRLQIWGKNMEKSVISKVKLRKQMLEQRKVLNSEEIIRWDSQVLQKLKTLGLEKNQTLYCYISVRGETGTEEIIRSYLSSGIRVAVPRVKGKEMDFYYITDYNELKPGCFGIPEPDRSCEKAECKKAPVIVPGVAFSEQFERTGYGAGYYDRFFEKEPEHEKIAICYDFQLVNAIAVESHDILMDRVLTPTRSLCRKDG